MIYMSDISKGKSVRFKGDWLRDEVPVKNNRTIWTHLGIAGEQTEEDKNIMRSYDRHMRRIYKKEQRFKRFGWEYPSRMRLML